MTVADRKPPLGGYVGSLLAVAVGVPLLAAGVAWLIYTSNGAARLALAVAGLGAAIGAGAAIAVAAAILRRAQRHRVSLDRVLAAAEQAAAAAEDRAALAQREAATAHRAREDFLASVTHALRSPLNACLMWIDVLALSPLADDGQKAVAAVRRNVELQAQLLNELGDFAQLSSGGIPLYMERADLEKLIDDNVARWRSQAEAAGLELAYAGSPGSYGLELDTERLLQVLDALLGYAFESTPAGGRVVLRLGEDGELVVIEVGDGSPGLDDDELKRLFTPFAGEDRQRRRLGLRLAIAAHLVERHGGSLTARNDGADEGCTFVVRLPRSATGAATAARRETSALE